MNSAERHELRYMRRKEKREEKRKAFLSQFDNIEHVANLDSLNKAAESCSKGVMWKGSTQKYMLNKFYNITKTRSEILGGYDIRRGFIRFTLFERGKKRDIRSVHIQERVPQKSLCHNVLIPALSHNLIYDNGACIKGKGVTFQQERCAHHLREHYKEHGNEGYVLVFDFHHYFDSIPHQPLIEKIEGMFSDNLIRLYSRRFIEAFGDIGLGLGSEICQILAVAYPNPIDHMIKDGFGIKGYGRYNDDGYVIDRSKEKLREIRAALIQKAKELGLKLNEKKTQIIKLTRGFRFLKIRYVLLDNGKVLKLPWRRSITKQRQKLKKFLRMVERGVMTVEQVAIGFKSWLGYMKRKNAYRARRNMIELYTQLFSPYGGEIFMLRRKDYVCLR